MAAFKYLLLTVLVVVTVCDAKKYRRSPSPAEEPDAKKQNWTPVSEPREFTVMVDDNINKANQFRHETWKPGGIIEGEYASPTRDGKWLKVNYRADKEGFHVLSQKVITEAELNQPSGGSAADHQAKVETQVNGKDVKYTVKEEDLKKNKEKSQQQQQHGGL